MAIILVGAVFFGLLLLFELAPDTPAKRLLRNDGPIFGPWRYWERQIQEARVSRSQAGSVVNGQEIDSDRAGKQGERGEKAEAGPALYWVAEEKGSGGCGI